MVRKSTRTSALKASEKAKVKKDPSRKMYQQKSISESDESDEEVPMNQKKPQSSNQREKHSSDNESDTDSKKPLKKRIRSKGVTKADKGISSESDINSSSALQVRENEAEEVNEENNPKGKSISVTNSNIDSNVNMKIENANAQVTDQSPKESKDDNRDELSKNGESMEIDVNISQSLVAEMTCDNQSSEITSEQTTEVVVEEHVKNNVPENEENLSDLAQAAEPPQEGNTEDSSSQEQVNENPIKHEHSKESSRRKIKLNRLPKTAKSDVEEITREELKGGKKITLKRPEIKAPVDSEKNETVPEKSEEQTWSSSYELTSDQYQNEEKSTRKKITLKRSTVNDDTLNNEKKELISLERSYSAPEKSKRRVSATMDDIKINEKKRRSSSGVDEKISENEDTQKVPKKITKVVKLVRKLAEISQEPSPPGEEIIKKFKWTQSQKSYTQIDALNLEYLKEICPAVLFLNEEEVNLNIEVTDKKSPEKLKRKTFMELEEEEMEKIEAELNAEPEEMELKENVIAKNRKISIVDDTASKLRPPPSPAKNNVSEVLFITNLVRPFTVKQLKELLGRTGKIKEDGFWTDRIKSKCYVCYETVKEAESTRNALHGVNWPIGNGKKLIIDYATMEDMENAKNPPVNIVKKEKSVEKENKKPDLVIERLEKTEKSSKRDDERRRKRSVSRTRERRHSRRTRTPEDYPKKRRHDEPVPQKAMDDLFLKTKATPSIYWQPLSPEEIARKQQMRQARLEQNKRRLEEFGRSGRAGVARDRGRDRNFRRR